MVSKEYRKAVFFLFVFAYFSVLQADPHWFQCRSGSSFLTHCGSGSRGLNQCEPIQFRILDRLLQSQKVESLNEKFILHRYRYR